MTKDEVFTQLREAFGLDSTLNRFKPLERLDGLREAVKYWDWAAVSVVKSGTTGNRWWTGHTRCWLWATRKIGTASRQMHKG